MKKIVLPVFLTGLWINFFEFFRNELLLKSFWTDHYTAIGMPYPGEWYNGLIWVIWGFIFAYAMLRIYKKHSFARGICLSWLVGFVLMWLVVGNLGTLPLGILPYAIPMSIFEVWVAFVILRKFAKKKFLC